MAAKPRDVNADPALEAEVERHREELRACGRRRSAQAEQLLKVSEDALADTPDGGTKILTPQQRRDANATTTTMVRPPQPHDSHRGDSGFVQKCAAASIERKNMLTQLKDTVSRVITESREIRLPGFDGNATPIPG